VDVTTESPVVEPAKTNIDDKVVVAEVPAA
jgi:hypothetical protein